MLFLGFASNLISPQIGTGTWHIHFLAILGIHSCRQIVFLFRIYYHALHKENSFVSSTFGAKHVKIWLVGTFQHQTIILLARGNDLINQKTHKSFVLSISNETTAFNVFRFFDSPCGSRCGTLAARVWNGCDEMGRNGFVLSMEILHNRYAFSESTTTLESLYQLWFFANGRSWHMVSG